MIDETLNRIEETLKKAENLDALQRDELIGLVAELKDEIADSIDLHRDHAQSIAGFAQITTHEATRANPDAQLVQLGLKGLAASIERFEASHPRLVTVANNIHQALANIGLG